MAIRLTETTYVHAEDYVYAIIVSTGNISLYTAVYYAIKGFLRLFSVSKAGSFVKNIIIKGEFKSNGIYKYWTKYKCKTIFLSNISPNDIERYIEHCKTLKVPYYLDTDFHTKIPKGAFIGPYWVNVLYNKFRSIPIKNEFNKVLNIQNG